MSAHYREELARLTAAEPLGIRQAASAIGEYLDCCPEPPPEAVVVWGTYPNCFEEVMGEPVAVGFDENGALLLVKHDVAMRVMPRSEFVRRMEADASSSSWIVDQMKIIISIDAKITVVAEARKDNGGHKNRVCVYGFSNNLGDA